jgi:2-oxoglutarate ferredoxin oxidoreductase subunit alpha
VVIVDVQRLGPSTGSATKGADGDIQFLQWGNSGGLPVIVLAPVDITDCIVLTMQAFNLAETYRCPVFLAANKEISMTRETVDLDAIALPDIVNRRQADPGQAFLPFGTPGERLTPDFLPIGGSRAVRQTSSTHGPDGYITADPELIARNQDRLQHKITSHADRFTYVDDDAAQGAETLIITYGVTARAAKTAVEALRDAGTPVSLLVLKTLWPVPENLLREKAGAYERIVVVEMNLGQYVREIRRVLPGQEIRFLGRMDGELIKPRQIEEVVRHG